MVLRRTAAENQRPDQGETDLLCGRLNRWCQFGNVADASVGQTHKDRGKGIKPDLVIEHRLPHQAGQMRANLALNDEHGHRRVLGMKLGKKAHFAAHINAGG